MIRTTCLLLVLAIATPSYAQTVDSLVHEAFRNNPQVKALGYKIQAAGSRVASAGSWPAPSISVEMSQIPTSSGDVLNDAISNNVSVSQMFMLGGKLSAMSEVERRRAAALEQNLNSLRTKLRAQVKMNYYRLWLLDRSLEIRRQTLSLYEELTRLMQPKVLTNQMRQADLYTLQAEAAALKAKLSEMYSDRVSLQNTMNSLLGRDNLARWITTDSLLDGPVIRLSERELVDRLKELNPSLLVMDRMREMNDAEITAAKKELIPDLMLQVMTMRMPNGMILTSGPRSTEMIQQSAAGMAMPRKEWMYSAMVSITLPFVPWASDRSVAKAEEIRLDNLSLDAEKEAMQREMIASLRSGLTNYATADSLVRLYENDILPLARQSAEAQTTAYQTGQVPVSSALDARRMELMRRDDYLMIVMNRQMALAEIEMMLGTPIQ